MLDCAALPIVGTLCIRVTSLDFADTNRYLLNLVIGLQLDVVLLVQNLVRILHCLSELGRCIVYCVLLFS